MIKNIQVSRRDTLSVHVIYVTKGVRGVYTYTGSHSKTVVFGLITLDGEGSSGDTAPLPERSLSSS